MNTQSNSETPKIKPLNAWDRPWTRLQIGYYLAVFVLISIRLGLIFPIESLPANLLFAAFWPAAALLAGIVGIVTGQLTLILISVACFAPYFMIADFLATWNDRKK